MAAAKGMDCAKWLKLGMTVGSRIIPSEHVQVLIPGTCKHVSLCGKWKLKLEMKLFANGLTLR